MSLIQELIKKAELQIGVQEEPKGSNTGKTMKVNQRMASYSSPVPWCMRFLYWCIDEVCTDLENVNVAKRTGDCDTFLNWGISNGIEHQTPAVGDLGFVMKSEHDAVHVFLVTTIEGSVLHTVEGNTKMTAAVRDTRCAGGRGRLSRLTGSCVLPMCWLSPCPQRRSN